MTTIESIRDLSEVRDPQSESMAQFQQLAILRRKQKLSQLTNYLENGLPPHQKLVAMTDPHITGSLTDSEPGKGNNIYRPNAGGKFELSANVRTIGRALIILGEDMLLGEEGPIVINRNEGIGISSWSVPEIIDLEQQYSPAWRILGGSIAGSHMQKSQESLAVLSKVAPGTVETLVFSTPQ